MTGLLGPDGRPISSVQNKKVPPPKLGEQFGSWAGENIEIMSLPGGGALQFDLNKLTLADFRQMKDHYQINASLSVLTFLMHQMEWHIEVDDNKDRQDFYEEQLSDVWSRLVRSMSMSFWSGYSPNVLQWSNDVEGRRVVLDKVKDLIPENCFVNWKYVDGYKGPQPHSAPVKIPIYDGIRQWGVPNIPVENSFWYPLLMEHGNYYGKKLLRSAFQSWFFSILLHLFANRYYERFGEPLPVGRAPYDEEIDVDGTRMSGNKLMQLVIQQLRSRSTVVLPNQKTQFADENTIGYDYTLEYLESQMRGADFERYMTRLDEEMSLALFTPILLMRTADVGSYNLGTQHTIIYQWMLNAMAGDWAYYINWYLLRPLRDWNFGTNAALPKIKFVKLGKVQSELLQAIFTALMSKDKVKFDVRELGEIAGLTTTELNTVAPETAPAVPPQTDPSSTETQATARDIITRMDHQVRNAFEKMKFNSEFNPSMGFRRRFEESLRADGHGDSALQLCRTFYEHMDEWIARTTGMGAGEFGTPETYMNLLEKKILREVHEITGV